MFLFKSNDKPMSVEKLLLELSMMFHPDASYGPTRDGSLACPPHTPVLSLIFVRAGPG